MNWGVVLQAASALGGITVLISVVSLPWVLRKMRSETKKTDSEAEKNKAEAAQVLGNTALAMLAPAQAEIDKLEKRLEKANTRADDLEVALGKSQDRVRDLEAEVQELRNQVGAMSKELNELRDENHILRGGEQ